VEYGEDCRADHRKNYERWIVDRSHRFVSF